MPKLQLPGDLTSLEPIADLVVAQAERAGLDKSAAYQLRLAVDEIATNIIVHGYQENRLHGEITVSADVDDHSLTVVLEDSAPPFNPLSRDLSRVQSEFDKPLAERQIGGLGVYFAIQAVSEYRYEFVDGRNRNTLVVRRGGLVASRTSKAQAGQR